MFIKMELHETMATGSANCLDDVAVEMYEEGIGVVCLIGTRPVQINAVQHRDRFVAVAGMTVGEPKSGQAAQPVDQGVNLVAQCAARSPQRLVAPFVGCI